MALSDYEESVIEELDRALAAQDPSFAREFEFEPGDDDRPPLRGADTYGHRIGRCSVLGCIAGVVIMLGFLATSVAMAFVGAVITLVSATMLWSAHARVDA